MIVSNTNILINLDDITNDYAYLNDAELELTIKHIEDHINNVGKTPSQSQWNSAWSDIANCNAPKYFKPRLAIDDCGVYRYKCQYIKSNFNNLEGVFHDRLLESIQNRFLNDIDCVVEFGCGTGHNLQKIRNRNPDIKVYGSDWAGSSQEILNQNNIPSWNFDMTKCDSPLPNEIYNHSNVCFMTIGSMEQIGSNWNNFFNFILSFKPKKSIHIEPILELYDPANVIDSLAIKYHQKRGYLSGFFGYVKNLDQLKFYERTYFGNTYNEGFTILELEYE